MPELELRDVDIVFGERPERAMGLLAQGTSREALKEQLGLLLAASHVSLKVMRGDIFVLMGLSGSGKSTLLRTLNGLCTPTRGEVRVADQVLRDLDANALRQLRFKKVSMVFQSAALMPWRTVYGNVAFGLELQKVNKADIKARCDEALHLVGLSDWALHKPCELSGGMRQRVGIARALAMGTEIILMDEPFSALDPLIRRQLQDELLHLQHDLKKTIVFVSHDLEEALRLGTQMAILKEGQIVQSGSPKEIIKAPADAYVERFVSGLGQHCPKCSI